MRTKKLKHDPDRLDGYDNMERNKRVIRIDEAVQDRNVWWEVPAVS